MELLYRRSGPDGTQPAVPQIRWLSADDYPVFCLHLELCGQKPLHKPVWDQIFAEGTAYCGFFVGDKMAGRACVEKYSQNAWEVADVRVAKPYRNQGYASMLCRFAMSYILSEGKTATIRTEEDNYAMQRVIEKLGFTKMRRIGILGGTFNPIHWGHLLLAEWARDTFELEEVWFIPTGHSYMKTDDDVLSGEERFHMVKLALEDNLSFRCLDTEVRRQGCSYSYETLEQLKRECPDCDFYFIVGADCLFSIENWKCTERIFQNCTLTAAVRDRTSWNEMEDQRANLERKFGCKIFLMPFIGLSVSSTEIRQRIREGKSVRYLVPDRVLKYIEEKGFYIGQKSVER